MQADLTIQEIARMNLDSGGQLSVKHAKEMIRQGKARSGGTYFIENYDIGRLVMGGKLYTYKNPS